MIMFFKNNAVVDMTPSSVIRIAKGYTEAFMQQPIEQRRIEGHNKANEPREFLHPNCLDGEYLVLKRKYTQCDDTVQCLDVYVVGSPNAERLGMFHTITNESLLFKYLRTASVTYKAKTNEVNVGNILRVERGYVHEFKQLPRSKRVLDGYNECGKINNYLLPRFHDCDELVVENTQKNERGELVGLTVTVIGAVGLLDDIGTTATITNQWLVFNHLQKVADRVGLK